MAGRITLKRKTALLIVDWQRFFVDPSSRAFVAGSSKAAPRIGRAARLFLDRGLPVFASLHYGEDDSKDPFFRFYGRTIGRSDPLRVLGEPVAGMAGLSVYGKNSYSLFENREFVSDIGDRDITGICLCGVLAEKCVLANAFAAFDKGFELFVVRDCVAARDESLLPAALSIIGNSCGELILSTDLGEYL